MKENDLEEREKYRLTRTRLKFRRKNTLHEGQH